MDAKYEIMDGVRRAKAAHLAGHQQVWARLYSKTTGSLIKEFEVSIEDLLSPHKHSIKRISPADEIRWQRVEQGATKTPLPFPPIEIVEGTRGIKIEDITFDFGGTP
jgi:hypothetical protein